MEREDRSTPTSNCEEDSGKNQHSNIAPVLILGAGINGAATARELLLNGVPVVLVDRDDIACGATSRSSRLIHGGLRYLEYGDFALVRESLDERERLLQLAPHFVKPLRLFIPIQYRIGGLLRSVVKFFNLSRFRFGDAIGSVLPRYRGRGLWLVRIGLCFYDFLSRKGSLPRHQVDPSTSAGVPRVNIKVFRWLCAYWDAQIRYPERFVIALLQDCKCFARQNNVDFQVFTYAQVESDGSHVSISYREQSWQIEDEPISIIQPSIIINASGSAGDITLEGLGLKSRKLFGGTKGSHFITYHKKLRESISHGGLYAEANDGRLVFVLPFGDAVLVGTTDERFDKPPEQAIASEEELEYLLSMVNDIFSDLALERDDIELHYSGVRPLPYTKGGAAASIPRGHWIDRNEQKSFTILTLIGGKLTTCRALGEEVTDIVLSHLELKRTNDTRQHLISGGDNYPIDDEKLEQFWKQTAEKFSLTSEQVQAIWNLCGNRFAEIFDESKTSSCENLTGTNLPLPFVEWVIKNEWVTNLEDLVRTPFDAFVRSQAFNKHSTRSSKLPGRSPAIVT